MYNPQAGQSAGASRTNRRHRNEVARAPVRAARALVFVSIFIFHNPCVFACRAVWHTQARSSRQALALQRAQTHNDSSQEPAVWPIVRHHRSLESPATAICRGSAFETGEEIRLLRVVWPGALCLQCWVQNLSFGRLWNRRELAPGFAWPGHFWTKYRNLQGHVQ